MPVKPPLFPFDPDAHVFYECYRADGSLVWQGLLRPSEVSRFRVEHYRTWGYRSYCKRRYYGPSELYGIVADLYDEIYGVLQHDPWYIRYLTLENLIIGIAVAGITLLCLEGAAAVGPEIAAWLTATSTEFTAIAEAVHLKTALKVHNIAMLVSKEYRKMWKDFYAELAGVSKELGYDAYYLALVFRNSRSLIIDASTTMGFSYDEADMIWLDKFDKYLTTFSRNAETYANNPEQLFYDLDQYLDKPVSDDKAQFLARTFVTLTNVVSVVDVTVRNLTVINDDVARLVDDLPPGMLKDVSRKLTNFTQRFDTFIEKDYEPNISKLEKSLDVLDVKLDKEADNIFQVIKRLKKPADFMLEIDEIPEPYRTEQLNKLNELVTRPLHSEADDLVEIADPTRAELIAIGEAERIPVTPLVGLPPEFPEPITPAGVSPKPRKTWFVGDY